MVEQPAGYLFSAEQLLMPRLFFQPVHEPLPSLPVVEFAVDAGKLVKELVPWTSHVGRNCHGILRVAEKQNCLIIDITQTDAVPSNL